MGLNVERVRDGVLLATIGLYLLLNYGFMQVRVPPVAGGGVPVGEIALALALLSLNHIAVLSKLRTVALVFPFLLWWTYGLGRAMAGMADHGIWALRDATHVIESAFLVVGFAYAARAEKLDRFFRWLGRLLAAGAVYALSYPMADTLTAYSPTLQSGAGYPVPILFNYTATPILLLMGAAWLMLYRPRTKATVALEIFLVGYATLLFQERTIYIQIAVLLGFFLIFRRAALGKGVIGLMAIVLAVIALPLTGITVTGRLGEAVSLDFIVNHILAIAGIESEGLQGTARGVSLRMEWWTRLLAKLASSPDSLLLGLGYGIPLTDHRSLTGAVVREPHNSYLSVLGRGGLIAATAFLWMHALMLAAWWRGLRLAVRYGWREGENRYLILMVFFLLVWVFAMGEDALEKPYIAIPYYFFWGVALRMTWHLVRAQRTARTRAERARAAPEAAAKPCPAPP